MAVFLVNQCTFSKLPNVCADQQTSPAISNGASPSNQNSNDSTSNLSAGSVGFSPSNICGLKFDSLFELIHHIEDNHITDVDYSGISGPFYNGQQQQPHHLPSPSPHHQAATPVRDSNIYNVIPHDRHHMTQIINGGWLPTSCILRIFNSTHKPQKPQIQPQTHQLMHKLQAPQHHLQTIQPIQGMHPQQMIAVQQSQTQLQQMPVQQAQHHLQAMQPLQGLHPQQMIAVQQSQQTQLQPMPVQAQQPLTVDMKPQMQPSPQQPMSIEMVAKNQLQPSPQQQTIQQQPMSVEMVPQNQMQPSPQQQQQPLLQQQTPTQNPIPKPVAVYKCTDCSKTYKTMHGLRTHQSTHHPNSPQTDSKVIAMLPEGGDTSSGSPAPISQQQQQQQQQPIAVEMVPKNQLQPQTQQQQQPMSVAVVVNVNNSIQQQQQQLQLQQPPPTQQQSQQQQQASTPTIIPKPAKVYKCTDCSKTYKTMHGLRTHQNTHHSNSPQTDSKVIAMMPEGGDTPSGTGSMNIIN